MLPKHCRVLTTVTSFRYHRLLDLDEEHSGERVRLIFFFMHEVASMSSVATILLKSTG